MKKLLIATFLSLALSACQPASQPTIPGVKIGKPYAVGGKMYYPSHDVSYDEVGMASWYGPGFHGKQTANGERFDQDAITAAHPTLPMPSLVRVTNLENGRSTIVRINDRGPFKSSRIIDLSRGTARKLGVTGLAKVRVQFLQAETEQHWASIGVPLEKIPGYKAFTTASKDINDTYIPPAPGEAQIESNAPIMSVEATSLDAPTRGSFGLISEANAAPSRPVELQPPAATAGHQPDIISQGGLSPPRDLNTLSYLDAPRATPPPHSGGAISYYLQVGAFSSKDNAMALARQLGDLGNAQTVHFNQPDKVLHRVRIGPYTSKEQAESLLPALVSRGIHGAKILWEK